MCAALQKNLEELEDADSTGHVGPKPGLGCRDIGKNICFNLLHNSFLLLLR